MVWVKVIPIELWNFFWNLKKVELRKNYNPEGEFGFTGFWTTIGFF